MDAGERLRDTAVTVRGLCVGCVLALGSAIGAPYGRQVIPGTSLALTSATPAAFFIFFLLRLLDFFKPNHLNLDANFTF